MKTHPARADLRPNIVLPSTKMAATTKRGGVRPQLSGHALHRRISPSANSATSLGGSPTFAYHGGPVIQAPRIHACFWGALWADMAHQTRQAHIVSFLTD